MAKLILIRCDELKESLITFHLPKNVRFMNFSFKYREREREFHLNKKKLLL
jgi:hypothetical protein